MDVCDKCKEQMEAHEPDTSRPFPAFTVAGGILGTLGAAATGAILLVPAAVIVGVLADSRRCGMCGTQIEDHAPGYRMMTTEDDDLVEQVYRPVVRPPFYEDQPLDQQFLDDPSEALTGRPQPEFVYDHIDGVLAPREGAVSEGNDFGGLAGEASPDLGSAGMSGMEGSGPTGGASAGGSAE